MGSGWGGGGEGLFAELMFQGADLEAGVIIMVWARQRERDVLSWKRWFLSGLVQARITAV